MKISAEDKLSALTNIARLLVQISEKDAEIIFNQAIEVAGELDSEAIHEIALFRPLADRAVDAMSRDARRAVACNIATVVVDAGVRLAGNDYFPWANAARAMATLDPCLALAATARWEDSGVIDREGLLPFVLETALTRKELSAAQAAAFLPLLSECSADLMSLLVEQAKHESGSINLEAFIEELAQEELMRFGKGRRDQVSSALVSLPSERGPGVWLTRLLQATAFHRSKRAEQALTKHSAEETRWLSRDELETGKDPFAEINWAAYRFVLSDEIEDVVKRVLAASRASGCFVHVSTILEQIASVVGVGNHVSHLEALARSDSRHVADYERAEAIGKRVVEWADQPSVAQWCLARLPQVVIDLFPAFSRWIAEGSSSLPGLLEAMGASAKIVGATLLEGIERHVDSLSASSIYALVGLLARYSEPVDAAQVISRYVDRLVQRIPQSEREVWELGDLPGEVSSGVARFLYALMGDIDVRIRWRSAHAARCLARVGETDTIGQLLELYGRTTEGSYRAPNAPFYWLAARLWLIISLDRIASESPFSLRLQAERLIEIASDDSFPHVVIRSFAKSAVTHLVERGALILNAGQRRALRKANTSPMGRRKARKGRAVGFKTFGHVGHHGQRFYFDDTDTLAYWYTEALKAFADVSGEEFLDAAEKWIVDRWCIVDNPWTWEAEPRKSRLSHGSMDHRHGSRPTLERFHTYLEWHAMWCAFGELMQLRPLVGKDDYYSYDQMLRDESLTFPPFWLADLRSMKPLEDRFWFPPESDVDKWLDRATDNDFLSELDNVDEDESIVVASYHSTRSSRFHLSAYVNSAFVSPATAAALVRALQTADSSWDYKIPDAEDELEIKSPPYKLVGWLNRGSQEPKIDERDSLRYEVRGIECSPTDEIAKALRIEFVFDNEAKWIDVNEHKRVFVYDAWGDSLSDADDERRYNSTLRSSGWRLRADRDALKVFLNAMKLDLIVEIEISKRNRDYGYSGYDEEKVKETRFDKVILLRRDGTIEAAEGHFGSWATPRS